MAAPSMLLGACGNVLICLDSKETDELRVRENVSDIFIRKKTFKAYVSLLNFV